jgi:deoxyribodipyrimidine photo-lyase
MIHEERIQFLNEATVQHRTYVLYWMQASQRTEYNHALEYALMRANELRQPLIVFFGITDRFPDANERHYYFMLEGLREVQSSLKDRGIRMVIRPISPERGTLELSKKASLVVVDRGYLRVQREWRRYVAGHIDCPLIQVESDVVVPVEEASPKEEYSAATFRPKIKGKLYDYLVPLRKRTPKIPSVDMNLESRDISDVEKAIAHLNIDRSVTRVHSFRGGTSEAKRRLKRFIDRKLDRYHDLRNDPSLDYLSHMSPYLHFGQISPLYIALQIAKMDSPGRDAYLEELIVRRELSMNYVFYNPDYDSLNGLPQWARTSLREHELDSREYVYALDELESAQTHDPYWNAAQLEMVHTGKMHGYMRMYWGKKIIEWSGTIEEAFASALYLNNKYEIDGRDPNGFTGIAWCFGKHDRPWKERNIFGKIRYMNAGGLRRKFNIDGYVEKITQKISLL